MSFREGGHRIDRYAGAPSATRVFSFARDKADARRSPAERVSYALDQLGVGRDNPARNRLFRAAERMLKKAVDEGRDAEHLEPVVPAVGASAAESTVSRLTIQDEREIASAQAHWDSMVRDGLVPAEILEDIANGEMAA